MCVCVYQLVFVFSIDCDNNSLTNSEIQQFNNNDVILLILTGTSSPLSEREIENKEYQN